MGRPGQRRLGSGLTPCLPLKPVGDVADHHDASGDDDGGRSHDAGANDERDASLVLAMLDGSDLPAFKNHVVGHDPAFEVIDLGGAGDVDARCEQRRGAQCQEI